MYRRKKLRISQPIWNMYWKQKKREIAFGGVGSTDLLRIMTGNLGWVGRSRIEKSGKKSKARGHGIILTPRIDMILSWSPIIEGPTT